MKPKKSAPPAPPAPPIDVTAEERYHLINDVAYFRATVCTSRPPAGADAPAESWCEAEAAIDSVLKDHGAK